MTRDPPRCDTGTDIGVGLEAPRVGERTRFMRAGPWPERPSGRSEQERETPRRDSIGLHLPAHVLGTRLAR